MATKAILVATLAVTGLAVADVVRRGTLDAETTAAFLTLFSALFLMRVVGQVVVALRAPEWLPAMVEWNLVPYFVLLPIQIVFLAAMAAIDASLFSSEGPLAEPSEGFGRAAIGFSFVYAASMAIRYGVRMRRRPDQRWFGGAIPIVFHVVLAAYVFTWGTFHAGG